MMNVRANFSLVLSIWLAVSGIPHSAGGERWSRQVSSSEWIPLANPRNQRGHNENVEAPLIPQIHQPLIPSSLPPELRQEYQQQLLQLQKTQESIQRLLLLQQQLKAQQQLLQSQGFLPNGLPDSEENKQALHQSAIANVQTLPELAPEVFVPPQISGQPRPPVYTQQNFNAPQGEVVKQYEDYSERQPDYKEAQRTREELREKERYVPETPSGNEGVTNDDGEEEIQVVYVPAETLAQRGQGKTQQRGRKPQFGGQDRNRQRQYANQQSAENEATRQRENAQEETYTNREFLQQLQREHEGTDRLLKEAREKELERLREERKEIQRRAKLQQAAIEREQELQRQRDAERNQKELERLEEAAKQRELERIREARERQRLEEIERARKVRINEEKRKQEEARQAEIERLAALERQKKAEIERTLAAQKELERIQEEERSRESDRSHLRQKDTSKIHHEDETPQAQPLVKNQHVHQHFGHSGKFNRHGRIRNKPRQRPQSLNPENSERNLEEASTTPPSPNQPPLAVYMSHPEAETRDIKVMDVLKVLKGAKTIDVLDTVGQSAPQVFVGPSNLEVPETYAKFDLPYLSSIEHNRVERRVDKLPFFVAPLSFNPPPGYSKIPFPAPHIGSVVVNNLDSQASLSQPEASLEDARKANLNPLIEPNSFSDNGDQVSYPAYDSSTTPSYTSLRQEELSSPSQYQSTPSYSNVETTGPGSSYKFRPYESPTELQGPSGLQRPSVVQEQSKLNFREYHSRPTYQEQSSLVGAPEDPTQYQEETSRSTTPVYKRPNVVTSFAYQESPQPVTSSTPIYEESYSHVRDESTNGPGSSQISGLREPGHREVVNRHQVAEQTKNDRRQEYVDPGVRYENPTQYNLPPELPPIHPQLPGLVNSLIDEAEPAYVQPNPPTTTTTTTTRTTTTTVETPATTQRGRGRHRGRIVSTRTTTTPSTLTSPSGKSRESNRTRRPLTRTRSRYTTTTTEEYRETYEPTRSKVATTTSRNSVQETYRRPASTKTQKYKHRETEESLQGSRNQVHNVQAHEADVRNSGLDSRQPENAAIEPSGPAYVQYDFASATTSRDNYPVPETKSPKSAPSYHNGEVDYSKSSQGKETVLGGLQDDVAPQHYQERYPGSDFVQSGIEETPVNGFNYQIRNEQIATTPTAPATRDFYYQQKEEPLENLQLPAVTPSPPFKTQVTDYHPALYDNQELPVRPHAHFSVNEDKPSGFGDENQGIYDVYTSENQGDIRNLGLAREQAPIELTTEATTTTTTTEPPPTIGRQRVRTRLNHRGRPDSQVQTRPRGPQDEYVRFSAVNNHNAQTTERGVSRHRENHRGKPKNRQPSHSSSQVQTEGNDYVRIQAPIRTYQKTIVTPPSTTQRTTTTTPAPTSPTLEFETPNEEIEYGFIRPPNFAPVQPVDNRYQNSYRLGDNQAQLQSIIPTDETAADSIPSHAEVSRNRPKYQTPTRRPASKSVTPTVPSETSPYTERPRTRVEEPKNNRLRIRGRKQGNKRRTTTTTSTTTEYALEDNNDLPIEENYPRPVQNLDLEHDRHQIYFNEKYQALPIGNSQIQRHGENSYSGQEFLLNFEGDPDQLSNPEVDQTQLASQSSRNYNQPGSGRVRGSANERANQDRDIYGSESQWSTKLTSTSFQLSSSPNAVAQNDRKQSARSEGEKGKYFNDDASANPPEIITAPPVESYVTVMVSSDDSPNKPVTASGDSSLEVSPAEGGNFGMKMGVEGQEINTEATTPATSEENTFVTSSTLVTTNYDTGNFTTSDKQGKKRVGGRRRRVRVRVRPAPSDDFVTAESQHFNSAVNNLFQEQWKYRNWEGVTTTESPVPDASVETKTLFEGFLEEVFKTESKTSRENDEAARIDKSESVPAGSVQSEVGTEGSEANFSRSEVSREPEPITSEPESITSEPETVTSRTEEMTSQTEEMTSWTDEMTSQTEEITSQTEAVTNRSEADPSQSVPERSESATDRFEEFQTTRNESEIARESDSPTDVPTTMEATSSSTESSPSFEASQGNDSGTESPLITTMTIPRKSWDSTRPHRDPVVLRNGEYYPYTSQSDENVLDDGTTGQDNEVFGDEDKGTTRGEEDSANEEIYPKNHRSEWSEVRYPSDPDFYSNNRQANATSQLPGVVAKSEDESSVRALSDYVKAIFDTMKSAEDGDKNETYSSDYSKSQDVATSSQDSSMTNPEARPTEVPRTTLVREKFVPEATETTDHPETDSSSMDSELRTEASSTTEETTKNASETKLGAVLRTLTTTRVSHMTEICYRGRCVMTKPKKEMQAR